MALTITDNLIVNGDAESGPVVNNFTGQATPSGWTLNSGQLTGVTYAAGGASDLNTGDSAAIGGLAVADTRYGGPDRRAPNGLL